MAIRGAYATAAHSANAALFLLERDAFDANANVVPRHVAVDGTLKNRIFHEKKNYMGDDES